MVQYRKPQCPPPLSSLVWEKFFRCVRARANEAKIVRRRDMQCWEITLKHVARRLVAAYILVAEVFLFFFLCYFQRKNADSHLTAGEINERKSISNQSEFQKKYHLKQSRFPHLEKSSLSSSFGRVSPLHSYPSLILYEVGFVCSRKKL